MSEEFEMRNDYILAVTQRQVSSNETEWGAAVKVSTLTRVFNFAACDVTTVASEFSSHMRADGGSSDAAASQMSIKNFKDFESRKEVEMMHRKLTELGGKPPSLSGWG